MILSQDGVFNPCGAFVCLGLWDSFSICTILSYTVLLVTGIMKTFIKCTYIIKTVLLLKSNNAVGSQLGNNETTLLYFFRDYSRLPKASNSQYSSSSHWVMKKQKGINLRYESPLTFHLGQSEMKMSVCLNGRCCLTVRSREKGDCNAWLWVMITFLDKAQ